MLYTKAEWADKDDYRGGGVSGSDARPADVWEKSPSPLQSSGVRSSVAVVAFLVALLHMASWRHLTLSSSQLVGKEPIFIAWFSGNNRIHIL